MPKDASLRETHAYEMHYCKMHAYEEYTYEVYTRDFAFRKFDLSLANPMSCRTGRHFHFVSDMWCVMVARMVPVPFN